MARGAKSGERRGGRKPGTRNKKTRDVIERLAELNCDPIEGMARLAMGEMDCKACLATGMVGKVQFYSIIGAKVPDHIINDEDNSLDEKATEDVTCPVCGGTKVEYIQTRIRADMFKELGQYVAPKLKSIEHTGKDGKELPQLNVILSKP